MSRATMKPTTPPAINTMEAAPTSIAANFVHADSVCASSGLTDLSNAAWSRNPAIGGHTPSIPNFCVVIGRELLRFTARSASLFAVVVSLILASAALRAEPPTPDLLWWKASEGTGTAVAAQVGPTGTTNSAWIARRSGSSLEFDGTDDTAVSDANLSFSGANKITIAAWVWLDDVATNQCLFFTARAQSYVFTSGLLSVRVLDAAGNYREESIAAPATGRWVHIAGVFDNSTGAGDVKLYYDAVLQSTTTDVTDHSGATTFPDGTLRLADISAGVVFPFNGRIDDVRVFTGELSAAQILAVRHDDANYTFASDGSQASVQDKWSQTIPGDIITLPPCDVEWWTFAFDTGGFTLANIELRGSSPLDADGFPTGPDGGRTIIRLPTNQSSPLIGIYGGCKINRIDFRGLAADTGAGIGGLRGVILISGSGNSVSNCRFYRTQNFPIMTESAEGSVLDHNYIHLQPYHVGTPEAIYVYSSSYGGIGAGGDNSFAQPVTYGGPDNFFIENNTFFSPLVGQTTIAVDSANGGRYVFRHNVCDGASPNNHGTETGGYRGGRVIEMYENELTRIDTPFLVGYRAGVGVVFNNTIDGAGGAKYIWLQNYRSFTGFSQWSEGSVLGAYGGADGTCLWDINDPGGPFFTGKAVSWIIDGVVAILTVKNNDNSNPGWTVNQWVGYTFHCPSCPIYPDVQYAEIIANTANTITYIGAAWQGNAPRPAAEAELQFYRCLQGLDQPGRGGGSLVTDSGSPNYTKILPVGWNDQITQKIWCWNNTWTSPGFGSGNVLVSNYHSVNIRKGEHYEDDAGPMTGYTPYHYPHPLQGVGQSGPAAARRVRQLGTSIGGRGGL